MFDIESNPDLLNKNKKERKMSKIKYISLFSGIGGFESGINNTLESELVFASEIDKNATISYEAIYNKKPSGDITKIHEKDIPDHELLVGGFPCQAFSINGKRLGFEDARGTLIYEVVRIAKEKQPKVLLLENVRGLLSHDKRNTVKTILQIISDVGYTVDFKLLNSKYFGVPQSRERVYFVAVRNDLVQNEQWKIEDNLVVNQIKKELIDDNSQINTFNFNYPQGNMEVPHIKTILEDDPDEKYLLSEKNYDQLVLSVEEDGIIIKEATKQGWKKAFVGDVVNFSLPNSKTRRGRVGGSIANTLEASSINQGIVLPNKKIRKFTPLEAWRLQGFSDNQFLKAKSNGTTDSQLYKQAGNAVTVNVIEAIIKELEKYF